jgi:hypothetical protein
MCQEWGILEMDALSVEKMFDIVTKSADESHANEKTTTEGKNSGLATTRSQFVAKN